MNVTLLENWIAKHEPQGATKLSALAEINTGTLRKILVGITENPGIDVARKLAEVIGVSLDELCNVNHSKKPPVT